MGLTRMAIDAAPTDPFQQYVKKLVDGEKEWPASTGKDAAELEAERRRLARELFDGAELVDLVGHSTPKNGYLRLGDWVLDPAEAERLASYLPESVKVVRLIGCGTATTPEGLAAVESFSRRGLAAYGTRHPIYTTHFNKHGVKRGLESPAFSGFLSDGRKSAYIPWPPMTLGLRTDDLAPAEPAEPRPSRGRRARTRIASLARLLVQCTLLAIAMPLLMLAWLGRRAWSAAAALLGRWRRPTASAESPPPWLARFLAEDSLLAPQSCEMPGLLTDPLLTFEIALGSEIWILEVLFDFEYARFYSHAGSSAERDRVYRLHAESIEVKGGMLQRAKTPLEAYLERAPPGVALIHRHEEAGDRCGRVPARRPSQAAPAPARTPARPP